MFFGKCITAKFISPFLTLIILIFLFSCNDFKKNRSHQNIPDSNIAKGKVLAATHCQSCHMFPDPSWLDAKNQENGVLHVMVPRLGIFYYGFKEYPSSRYDGDIDKNFYPSPPVLKLEEAVKTKKPTQKKQVFIEKIKK